MATASPPVSSTRPRAPSTSRSPAEILEWLQAVLWPGPDRARVTVAGSPPRGFRTVERYGIVPRAGQPRLLVPLDSRRAAAASLRQFNSSMAQQARLKKAGASVGMRAGLGSFLSGRLTVSLRDGPPGEEEVLLQEHLREVLGRRDLLLAIMPGRPERPNRKPVLQLVAADGTVLGYAKIGWSPLTRRLVSNEARVLRAWERKPPRAFAVPRLLYRGVWGGQEITVTTPVPARAWRSGRRNASPPAAAVLEVARLGGTSVAPLGPSAYWDRVRRRVAKLERSGRPGGRRLAEVVERARSVRQGRPLAFGTWHGDWTPWNMERTGGTLFVWDWERCGHHVPLGLDVAHFHFQTRFRRGARSVSEAIAHSLRHSPPILAELGVEAGAVPLVHALYLLELLVRHEEVGAAGDGRLRDAIAEGSLEALSALEGMAPADLGKPSAW